LKSTAHQPPLRVSRGRQPLTRFGWNNFHKEASQMLFVPGSRLRCARFMKNFPSKKKSIRCRGPRIARGAGTAAPTLRHISTDLLHRQSPYILRKSLLKFRRTKKTGKRKDHRSSQKQFHPNSWRRKAACRNFRVAVISAKNQKRQRRNRQSVTAKREKSQTPKVLNAILTLSNLT